jgi:hypothetical protein
VPQVLVVCEGRVTEREYLEGLRLHFANRLVRVKYFGSGAVPITLVERAIASMSDAEEEALRQSDSNLRYDEVWCVYDVDDHHHLQEARDLANGNGINVAISNPCIELWLLLHFADQTAYLWRTEARRRLRAHVPDFDKHVDFKQYVTGYQDACRRATQLAARHGALGEDGANPSTSVSLLTEKIRQFGRG